MPSATVRRVDAADAPREDAAPAGDEHSVDRLLAAVLPFQRLDAALRGVAAAWHDLLHADRVIVGAVDVDAIHVTAAMHDAAGASTVPLYTVDRRITDADSLQRVLASHVAERTADWIPRIV